MAHDDTSCPVARRMIRGIFQGRRVLVCSPLDYTQKGFGPVGVTCSPALAAATFYLGCVSDTKPKRTNGMKCFMALVLTYLILLSVGAGFLVMKGEAVLVLSSPSGGD